MEDSLRRLGTDRIDLYQLHTPDPDVPIARHAGRAGRAGQGRQSARDRLLQLLGRAASRGRSGCRGARTSSACRTTTACCTASRKATCCPNASGRASRFCPTSRSPTACSPASTARDSRRRKARASPASGHFADWLSDANLDKVEALIQFAEARGHTILELAVSWLLAKPVVASVIAGATKAEQITANVGAASWKLTAEEIAEIERLVS